MPKVDEAPTKPNELNMTTTDQIQDKFQGVVYYSIHPEFSLNNSLARILDLAHEPGTNIRGTLCHQIELKNKYYQATVHIFDYDWLLKIPTSESTSLLSDSHAIVLQGNGIRLSTESLDETLRKLEAVCGEPRILLYNEIDESCPAYSTLLDWCIKNGFDLIDVNSEDVKQQIMDSLSVYKWKHRTSTSNGKKNSSTPETSTQTTNKLDDELFKKLVDFDQLLNKLSVYRDQPELRGNPDDKNIVEIAEILSNLLTDDGDEFLKDEDEDVEKPTSFSCTNANQSSSSS